jgi:hypothetical protein
MNYELKIIFSLIILLFLSLPVRIFAGSDSSHIWKTIHTKNFSINFYQGGENFAELTAEIAEEVHEKLTSYLNLFPTQKTEIVIMDEYDSSNGLAGVYPYNVIQLYAFPPESFENLSDFSDWIKSLFTHEYVHIIQLEQVSGIMAFYNSIFGKTLLPNTVLPDWFTEGVATGLESYITGRGRVKSSLFEMYLRMAIIENNFLDISEITHAPLKLPRGNAAYLYGGCFIDFIVRKKGISALTDFIKEYGRRIIPFSLNILAKKYFGETFIGLYSEWKKELEAKFSKQKNAVISHGVRSGDRITDQGEYFLYPVFSGKDRIAYVRDSGKDIQSIEIMSLKTGEKKKIADCYGGCGKIAFDRKRNRIIYPRLEFYKTYHVWSDLYATDIETAETVRLTHGKRLREPNVLDDGRILAVSNKFEKTMLVVLDPSSGKIEDLISSEKGMIISQAAVSRDGKKAVVSAFAGGQWDLYMIELEKTLSCKSLIKLTDDRAIDRDPVFSAQGNKIFFVSDRIGIYNIYSLDYESMALSAVTNVIGGAFFPDVLHDGKIIYSSYSSSGYDIYEISSDDNEGTVVNTVSQLPFKTDQPVTEKMKQTDIMDYSPFETLYPRSLKPTYIYSSGGISRAGLEITGKDVAGFHDYLVKMESDTDDFDPLFQTIYTLNRYYPTISFAAVRTPAIKHAFVNKVRTEIYGDNFAGSAFADFPFFSMKRNFIISFGYIFEYERQRTHPSLFHDPAEAVPYIPYFGKISGISAGMRYVSTEAYTYSISNEKGIDSGFSFFLAEPQIGSDFRHWTIYGHLYGFLPVPFIYQHVLALKLSGAASRGHKESRSLFGIGGFPQQDILNDLINRGGISGNFLRGFPHTAFIGDAYYLINAEYRFPFFRIFQGFDTLPVYLQNLHTALFCDAGDAFFGMPDMSKINYDCGFEMRLETSLFYSYSYIFRLGYAHGFTEQGVDTVYFIMGL